MARHRNSRRARVIGATFAVALVLALFAPISLAQENSAASNQAQQLRRAIRAAQQGNTQQALTLTHALVNEHPDFVPALKLQGELLEEAGHDTDAAESYSRALKLAPNDPDLLLKVGIDQLVTGNYPRAVELLHRRLGFTPHDRDTLFYLAQSYHLNGQNQLALKTITECLHVAPDNASVLQKYGELLASSGNNQGAVQWLLKAQHADPTLPRINFDLGAASYNSMDFAGALKYSAQAAAHRPNDPEVLALYAATQVKLAQWQDAEATFQRILNIKPADLTSLLGLGHCEVELKEYSLATETLREVLHMDPTQILAHFYLSRAYAGLGKTAEAQQEADIHNRMLQEMSGRPAGEDVKRETKVWNQARQLLIAHHEEAARRLFKQSAVGPSATPGNSYVLLGALYLSLGNTRDAQRNLNRALQINPSVQGAYTYLGILALQQGDLSRAEQEFDAELAHHPNYLAAIAEIGAVRYRQGRWAQAAQQIARSNTTDPTLLYMLCDSYFRLGRTQDAEVTAQTLADYARHQSGVMQGLIELANRNGDTSLAQRLTGDLSQ
jgi:tetratricopeptide (TPR) repeat protein